jgi:predicted nuclease of predicted toxin-antitoxin system
VRILANENVPGDAVDLLRSRGHDVSWVRIDSPGASDETILARAVREHRLLVTFDKDFGDLVFRKGSTASCGVVLLRITSTSARAAAVKIAEILQSRTDWVGFFSVADEARIRMVPLPAV